MNTTCKTCFMKAVMICFKPWLKSDEAMLYCNLKRAQFLNRCREFGIQKNSSGYYNREHLDRMLSGEYVSIVQRLDDLLNDQKDS